MTDGLEKKWSEHFFEVRNCHPESYRFFLDERKRLSYSTGQGDYGLLVYKKPLVNYVLRLKIHVPEGRFYYANSGLFFGFKDVWNNQETQDKGSWPPNWAEIFDKRSPAFAAEWIGYEVQLHAGDEEDTLPENQRNLSVYKIPLGGLEGQQQNSRFSFRPGESYDLLFTKKKSEFVVKAKQEKEDQLKTVTKMKLPEQFVEEARLFGIQSYYNNGRECRAFSFSQVHLSNLDG